MAIISDDLAKAINNSSPAAQNAQLGTRLQEALAGELPTGSISTDELEANAVTLPKVSAGLLIGVAVEDAKTTSRNENIDGLSSAIALANSLKTIMDAHAADAAEHTSGADATNFPIVASDATDLTDLITLVTELLTAYDAHEGDSELGAAWAFHVAQEAGDVSLASAVAPTTLNECITRLNDLKSKYNSHDADSTAHTTGSTHQEATTNAALGTSILVAVSGAASGDLVSWGILNGGSGSVTGVTAVAGTDTITFDFSAEPQDDAIINYAVFRVAT